MAEQGEALTNTFGCDSVVLTTTTLLPSDTTNVVATTCDPAQVGITQTTLTNTFGCDSVVLTMTTLLPSDTTNVVATTCDPAQVGITQQVFSNTFGCDSLVITTTTLLPGDPVINCPVNITVNNDPEACGAVVNYLAPIGTDNCPGATTVLTSGLGSGALFPIGTTTETYTVTDVTGNTATCSFEVNVTNDDPLLGLITTNPADPIALGSSVAMNASFTDNNIDNENCNWNWGDGTSDLAIINGQIITGEHNYTMPGVYAVTLSIRDKCGVSVTELYQYIVVYDPSGGFVTGGGWINSPLGAYTGDPLLSGKANFGFVSKYKKGATVPTGNTEFQFKAGDLKFKSYVYEWLVIAGKKAKFKVKVQLIILALMVL